MLGSQCSPCCGDVDPCDRRGLCWPKNGILTQQNANYDTLLLAIRNELLYLPRGTPCTQYFDIAIDFEWKSTGETTHFVPDIRWADFGNPGGGGNYSDGFFRVWDSELDYPVGFASIPGSEDPFGRLQNFSITARMEGPAESSLWSINQQRFAMDFAFPYDKAWTEEFPYSGSGIDRTIELTKIAETENVVGGTYPEYDIRSAAIYVADYYNIWPVPPAGTPQPLPEASLNGSSVCEERWASLELWRGYPAIRYTACACGDSYKGPLVLIRDDAFCKSTMTINFNDPRLLPDMGICNPLP